MNLDDLRAAQVDERGTDSLQPLPPTFYEQAAAYLADLRGQRDRLAERVDDPFDSEEVRQLTDELETAEEVVEAVYERRVGKLVKRASLAAAGVPTDEAGLTEEEQALFTDLVERIEAHRGAVLDVLEGGPDDAGATEAVSEPPADDRPDATPDSPAASTEGEPTEADRATGSGAAVEDVPSVGTEPPADREPASDDAPDQDPEPDGGAAATAEAGPADEGDPDRVTVRITADVGEIYGVDDRVYTLGDEDVVTLPSANARPLLERGAAQRVD